MKTISVKWKRSLIKGYLNSNPSKSGTLSVSRSAPTRQSSIKEHSERPKDEINRREKELSEVVEELQKTFQECQRELERRLGKEQMLKELSQSVSSLRLPPKLCKTVSVMHVNFWYC